MPIVCLATSLAVSPQEPTKAERIDRILRHYHEHGMFTGAMLVREGGETIYEGGFGELGIHQGQAINVDTCFLLGSVSKQFTAVAVLLLVEEGVLSLSDELVDYLPEFAPLAAGVTLHHLLTHSSGVPDYLNELGSARKGLTNAQALAALLDRGELNFAPGTGSSYSNGGYLLLAQIVEKASGHPLPSFLARRVFEPLGMTRTFLGADPGTLANRAVGFDLTGTVRDYTWRTTGPGGIFSTVRDLAKWDEALHEGRLIGKATLSLAMSPHELADGTPTRFGYGWQVVRLGSILRVFHAGGSAGYQAYAHRDLESGNVVIALSNCRRSRSDVAVRVVDDVLNGRPVDRLPPVELPPYLGMTLRRHGIERALERYDEIHLHERDTYRLDETALLLLGHDYLSEGDAEIALALFARNAEAYTDSWRTYDCIGDALSALGEFPAAMDAFLHSLELNPGNARTTEKVHDISVRLEREE